MDEPTDHCEHCDKQSCRWVSEGLAELHRDHNGAEWAGICPACAERERIVALLKAAWFYDGEREGVAAVIDLLGTPIGRGAHLEGQ